MSYDFISGGNRRIHGTYSTAVNLPLTIAAWVWGDAAAWAETTLNYVVSFAAAAGADTDSISLNTSNAADQVRVRHRDASNSNNADYSFTDGTYDSTWVLIVGTWVGVSERNAFVNSSSATAQNTNTRSAIADMDEFRIGANQFNSQNSPMLIAEVGLWNIELSAANIDALSTSSENGVRMSSIAAANNIGYWPLSADSSTHADQSAVGSGPTLTVTNATFNADHPTITGGGAAPKSNAMRLFM